METLEKLKLKPEGTEWLEAIGGKASPGKRWQLVFTKGKNKSSGSFFPLSACQRWDASAGTIENGVYLGGILALIFKGPFVFEGKVLRFDFSKVGLRLGPIKLAFNIKPEANDVVEKIIAGGGEDATRAGGK